ncbi:uncharacterized protein LOC111864643 [Cryptotermes secundus]|nr:uncharacterized protein LOC111864643 [Cryptotermes secundus]
MNRRNDPLSLQGLVFREVRKMVREMAVKWTRRLHSAAVRSENRWLQEIRCVEQEIIHVHHTLGSPHVPMFSDYIVRYAVKDFAKIIACYDNNIGRAPITQSHRYICTSMLKAVLLPCMSRYNIGTTESKFVQGILIQLLYVVPNIQRLILPPEQRLEYMQPFLERIQILTNLREFHFHIGCTREIIIELSKYCPLLKRLSVEGSVLVDDMCVKYMLKLRLLRSVNVSNTSLSSGRYRALLLLLPHVQEVIWSGSVDVILTNLSRSLPSVTKFDGTISDAGLLVDKLPNVKQLLLRSLTHDMSDLGELRNVTCLSIWNCSSTVISLSDALISLGETLSVLETHEVEDLNIDDIIFYCTVLNELHVNSCSTLCTRVSDCKLAHFRNLKKLKLRYNRGLSNFCSFLHFYVNLKVFHVAGMSQMNDAFFAELVGVRGFRTVTEFVVDHCGYLSMRTINLMTNNCPNLAKFGNIGSWPGVTKEEEVTFLNFVRNNNLALTVCH